jgi:preprotein translocase subunit SecA
MGGILLHRGEVIEMRTGEGKTLVGTVPLYLNALVGRGVQLVTVNDYLARRDGGWMGNVFHFLGLTVGCIGPQQFSSLFDPDYVNPGAELEDERLVHWRPCTRQQAYKADITYGISSEFGFDYLRDNMVSQKEKLVQRDLYYAIIDEVDNVLIDEARTPLIISGPAAQSGKEYARFAEYVRRLKRNTADEEEEANGHYDIDEKSRSISLTDMGIAEIEQRIPEIDVDAGGSLYDPQFYHLTYYLDNALKAEYMFKRDVQYMVQDGQVIIIDDFTGRPMPGRRYSDGLHEAIEAKEGVQIKRETVTVATITLQNYFRLYDKLGGMTGTAVTDAEEFDKIYELGVTPLPTNVQYIVDNGLMALEERRQKVENAEEIAYLDPESKKPKFFKRTDYPDQVYGTEDGKDQAIVSEIKRVHESGRPVLVGTTSVEHSEIIHKLLRQDKIEHQILNAKIHQSEALTVAQAGRKSAVTISTNMAGRGTDILLGGNPEGLAAETLEREMFDRPLLAQLALTLLTDSEENARQMAQKHPKLSEDLVDELRRIQTQFDMAMEDIEKEQVIGYLSRTLQEPYDIDYNNLRNVMRLVRGGKLGEARELLEQLDKDVALVEDIVRQWDMYTQYQTVHADPLRTAQFLAELAFERNYNARAALIRAVLGNEEDEAQEIVKTIPGLAADIIDRIKNIRTRAEQERREVWQLGGLHVIGSERHESRRIDNQLRGRAARQGDPGSSRFFLSLEDDLMKRFGGERLKGFMARTNIPEDMPIEAKVLDRLIESSQERLEGFNFDMRKNIVEYDDVMNLQRQAIYDERRAILMGEADDLDTKLEDAFANSIAELVDNYIDNYRGYVRGEVERVVGDFSTDATGAINLNGILRQLRGLLPGVVELDRNDLADLPPDKLIDELMLLAYENEESGHNLYQLLQAMGRFLPLLPPVPNLGALSIRKSGQVQAKEAIRREYLQQVESLFDEFLAEFAERSERDLIWQKASGDLEKAFNQFSVDGLSVKTAEIRQTRFRTQASEVLRDLLLDSLSALDSEQLVAALNAYIQKQQQKWLVSIGDEEFANFRRLLMLSAIDREWRDYLTAMDDLRREIGLSAIAQRDPKIEYKRRSYEMFQDMRRNIERDMVDRFFREIAAHQAFIQQQEREVSYQTNAQEAGYQVIKRQKGRGVELRRDAPKVGRNDLCPCGSGKKYKNCHMRQDQENASGGPAAAANGQSSRSAGKPGSRKKKKSRRR